MFENEKRMAAMEALKFVRNDMRIGIGTGSTAYYFIEGLSELVKNGLRITGIPTSKKSEELCRSFNIPVDYNIKDIDIDFDGADEFDPYGNLIKGGGGALVREKIVAYNSREFYVLVDHSKYSERLHKFPLPVEVLPFMSEKTLENIERLGCRASFRDDKKFISDNGNYIIDCVFSYTDPELESQIKMIPGVVEVGIFRHLSTKIFQGTIDGCRIIDVK
ncbi:ribose-5-phosphate isomerase RpiA [Picrophilus oshimae]|uniref:Ribose-5-phosphate isomerase A n=1 Tax=Picrophilus torridus (strain ATCC 700027 / DSM 9790 / JCM 10055 / NBRC 100828 / KAW 2/3) TaxID=1122961 RepID=RPIA_PICTO|nr:ribose-5-phosphate isomerase RpiA [Picrophilus oshimae]Q6L1K2.1 RecName: Full=Ribose-5-phosphate isomerase A; AltName: Full=Phosphoriboisomerase A; Short=PRI [Picrophilus oshimae DSM 9789]AAT43150.1 ribose 5-phosphate isomerase [Picrophilus oshimae DSM 9789]